MPTTNDQLDSKAAETIESRINRATSEVAQLRWDLVEANDHVGLVALEGGLRAEMTLTRMRRNQLPNR